MKPTAALLLFFSLGCTAMNSQSIRSAFSQSFRNEAIATIDAIDTAYQSVLGHDPDSVYEPLWQDLQRRLASLRKSASQKREKELLKLLYAGSNVIGMLRSCANCDHNNYEFRHEAVIVEQCSTEAKLKIEREIVTGKILKDFKSNQCLVQIDALAKSIE